MLRFIMVESGCFIFGLQEQHTTAAALKYPSAKIAHLARMGAGAAQLAANATVSSTTTNCGDVGPVDSRQAVAVWEM